MLLVSFHCSVAMTSKTAVQTVVMATLACCSTIVVLQYCCCQICAFSAACGCALLFLAHFFRACFFARTAACNAHADRMPQLRRDFITAGVRVRKGGQNTQVPQPMASTVTGEIKRRA